MGAGSPGRGDQALAAKPHPGRTPFLTADQEKQVLGWLAEPPTKHGFGTDLWAAKRVAQLILQKLKVRFHPHYLREWLTTRNYPPQKPARRAKQQDPVEIAGWLQRDWPRIKKTSGGRRPTSSGSTRPGYSSTPWPPRGDAPPPGATASPVAPSSSR